MWYFCLLSAMRIWKHRVSRTTQILEVRLIPVCPPGMSHAAESDVPVMFAKIIEGSLVFNLPSGCGLLN